MCTRKKNKRALEKEMRLMVGDQKKLTFENKLS